MHLVGDSAFFDPGPMLSGGLFSLRAILLVRVSGVFFRCAISVAAYSSVSTCLRVLLMELLGVLSDGLPFATALAFSRWVPSVLARGPF